MRILLYVLATLVGFIALSTLIVVSAPYVAIIVIVAILIKLLENKEF